MINDEIASSYDKVNYKSLAFEQCSIDRMCAMARIHGLNAPEPSTARVLEIGCASGGNLIAQALNHPNADFVGFDLSQKQIEIGKNAIEQSCIKNLKLLCLDACKATEYFKDEKFDYIIVHGVFSWVPDFVRDAILQIGEKLLSDRGGVMMISYNVYPGWKFKEITRDFMRFATCEIDEQKDPQTKLDAALGALEFEKAVYRTTKVSLQYEIFSRQIKACVGNIEKLPRSYLLHEYLEMFNEPFYLNDFVGLCQNAGLCYVADMTIYHDYDELNNQALENYAKLVFKDRIAKEQMFDFLHSTAFRHSLITKKSNENSILFDYEKMDFKGVNIGIKKPIEELRQMAKNLEVYPLICALFDAYPGTISAEFAASLLPQNTLGKHLANIKSFYNTQSALSENLYFTTKEHKTLAYEPGKTRFRKNYENFVRFLASDTSGIFTLSTPKNAPLSINKADFDFIFMLDGKVSKADIIAHLINIFKANGVYPTINENGAQKELKTQSEQEAYLDALLDKFIKMLQDNFMFEEIPL